MHFSIRTFVRSVPLLVVTAVSVAAQAPGAARRPSAQATAPIPLDPAVVTGKLPNGLTYYIRKNARPEHRAELRLVVNAGSILEDDDQRGLAHFVEHMLFNGTRRFQKNEVVSFLESIGVRFGADLNAYTSFDETVYILPVPTDKPGLLERSFDVLEDWASSALFDSAEVVAERGVVLDEWRRGRGATARIRDKQFPVIFRGSRYAERMTIGLPDVIEGANPAPLKRFYHDWYRPDLMAIIAVGDVDVDATRRLITEHFATLRNPANARPRPSFPVPPNDSTLVTVVTDAEQQLSTVLALYKHTPAPLRTRGDYRQLLVRNLYNDMLNDRFGEITHRPNAPFSVAQSSYGSFVRSSDVYQLVAATPDSGIERGLQALLTEARRVDVHGFLPAELQRAKTGMLRSLESAYAERDKSESADFASEYVEHFLTGEPSPGIAFEYDAAKTLLPGVTLEEVNTLGRNWITEKNRVIAVSAPAKAESKVPNESEILADFKAADRLTVAPWTESVSASPLVGTIPAPGKIVSESRIDALGVTDWKLSNGVRVLLKSTDFKADEVLMRAWSPGGASLVSDADFPSSMVATLAIERGGAGNFDAIELQKKLVGKQAVASPVIDNLTEGFGGRASPKDIETLFQLVYMKFAMPRRDSSAFEAFRAQIGPFFANRANNPEAVFGDTVVVTMAEHHPRAQPVNNALLEKASFAKAWDIYKDRFADASDFTFLFVGAVKPSELKPLVEQWLGSLPSTGRKESGKDNGMRTPKGVIEKSVRKGVEPKAQTMIFYTGDAEFTPANRYALRSLSEVLETKLLETLREALGGTYSVNVNGQLSREPHPDYSVVINFGSAPERADSLYRAVQQVIEDIRTTGVSETDVQKVREQQLRTLEVSERENAYWLGNISARIENGEDPTGLLRYREFIKALTPAQVQEAARRYLSGENVARFVLLPEKPAS